MTYSSNEINLLDKAQSCLRQFELERAMQFFFQLLALRPTDLDVINRMYPLLIKNPGSDNYRRICQHIFSLHSHSAEAHKLIIQAYQDYKQLINEDVSANENQAFNLLFHLTRSHLTQDADSLYQQIIQKYANSSEVSIHLKLRCEALISQNKLLKARDEMKYIIAYYAETNAGNWAIQKLNDVNQQIIR